MSLLKRGLKALGKVAKDQRFLSRGLRGLSGQVNNSLAKDVLSSASSIAGKRGYGRRTKRGGRLFGVYRPVGPFRRGGSLFGKIGKFIKKNKLLSKGLKTLGSLDPTGTIGRVARTAGSVAGKVGLGRKRRVGKRRVRRGGETDLIPNQKGRKLVMLGYGSNSLGRMRIKYRANIKPRYTLQF